jgi:hypothetical protein
MDYFSHHSFAIEVSSLVEHRLPLRGRCVRTTDLIAYRPEAETILDTKAR